MAIWSKVQDTPKSFFQAQSVPLNVDKGRAQRQRAGVGAENVAAVIRPPFCLLGT